MYEDELNAAIWAPSTGQPEEMRPLRSTRSEKIQYEESRKSPHATIAPPEPSGAIIGWNCCAVCVHSARPEAGQSARADGAASSAAQTTAKMLSRGNRFT